MKEIKSIVPEIDNEILRRIDDGEDLCWKTYDEDSDEIVRRLSISEEQRISEDLANKIAQEMNHQSVCSYIDETAKENILLANIYSGLIRPLEEQDE
jgi:hypothetical protein